ncbi:VOC family protein [Andreprevotia chitinilytica]|uniref:VOC family protein n=1 Tax=Andreprevotia chitinilytica TaxID=396808 RepID=UPI00054D9E54|nr:VOC family protein [Andreprevotia chitinilytica]
MQVQSYLFFYGRCDEALAFYADTLGAQITFLTRFKDAPPEQGIPGWEDKVMHANFQVGETQLMASDGMGPQESSKMKGCSLSIGADSFEQGERVFKALAEGGEVVMPYQATFWASGFGMLVDKFGVHWMVNCPDV